MKLKPITILVAAGLAFAGCNSNNQNDSHEDSSMMMDTSMNSDTIGAGMSGDSIESGLGAGSATDSNDTPTPAP